MVKAWSGYCLLLTLALCGCRKPDFLHHVPEASPQEGESQNKKSQGKVNPSSDPIKKALASKAGPRPATENDPERDTEGSALAAAPLPLVKPPFSEKGEEIYRVTGSASPLSWLSPFVGETSRLPSPGLIAKRESPLDTPELLSPRLKPSRRNAQLANFSPESVKGFRTESFVQGEFLQRVDVLFVVDNSESMADVREFLKENLNAVIEPLAFKRKQLDFRVALTTIDPEGKAPGLYRTRAGKYFVSGSSPLSSFQKDQIEKDWQEMVGQLVSEKTTYRGWEQGLKAAALTLEKSWSRFVRSKSHLVVVWLTDEDDYSTTETLREITRRNRRLPYPPEANRDKWEAVPVKHYSSYFREVEKAIGGDVLLYPIIHNDPERGTTCDAEQEPDKAPSVGRRYLDLISQWPAGKGAALSICRENLLRSFEKVAELTADRDVCVDLSQRYRHISVKVGGRDLIESNTNGFFLKTDRGTKLCFTPDVVPMAGEKVEVSGLTELMD